MKEKLCSLDVVRAAACLGILSFHMYLSLLGSWGVTVFFVLSAFLMTYNYLDRPMFQKASVKNAFNFSLKKTMKLYPLHLLTLLFSLLLQMFAIVIGHMEGQEGLLGKLTLNILLLHSFCPTPGWYFSFNSVSWYLSSLMIIYMFFPLILRSVRKYRSTKNAWLTMFLTLVLQPLLTWSLSLLVPQEDFSSWLSYICPFIRLGDYIIGCNLAYLFLNRKEKDRSEKMATILEIAAIVLSCAGQYLYAHASLPICIKNSTVFLPGTAMLVWCFAGGNGYISRALTGRITHFISDHSSYIFLIHPVVIQFTSIVLERIPIDYQLKRWCFLLIIPTVSFALAILYRNHCSNFHLLNFCKSKGESH